MSGVKCATDLTRKSVDRPWRRSRDLIIGGVNNLFTPQATILLRSKRCELRPIRVEIRQKSLEPVMTLAQSRKRPPGSTHVTKAMSGILTIFPFPTPSLSLILVIEFLSGPRGWTLDFAATFTCPASSRSLSDGYPSPPWFVLCDWLLEFPRLGLSGVPEEHFRSAP